MDGVSSNDRQPPFLVRVSSEENKTFAEDKIYAKKMLEEKKTVHPDEFKISSGEVRTLGSGRGLIKKIKSFEDNEKQKDDDGIK